MKVVRLLLAFIPGLVLDPNGFHIKKLFASVPFYCRIFCLVIVMNLLAANIFNHKWKKQKSIIHNVNNDALVFNKSLVYISDLK